MAQELTGLPQAILDSIDRLGIAIVACHDSITDYATSLHDQHPRYWPPGATWDAVPGAYVPQLRKVVIATLPSPDGQRHVPVYGELQGSRSLVIHETMHGYDYGDDRKNSSSNPFLAARQADFALLGSDYFQNAACGAEETYAESAAMHFGRDQTALNAWPHLSAFWANFGAVPFDKAARKIAPVLAAAPKKRRMPDTIGTAMIGNDGTILLDLKAHGEKGEAGHARLIYRPGDAQYAQIRAHIQPAGRALAMRPGGQAAIFPVRPFR